MMIGLLRELIIRLRNDKKIIPILVTLVILTQSITVIQEAWLPDKEPDYKLVIIPSVEKCDITKYPQTEANDFAENGTVVDLNATHPSRDPLKSWLNCLSFKEFNTPKLIPNLFNLGLMPLVYLLAFQITKDRLVGLIAFVAFINNPLYSDWVKSGTYDQIWSFFLILSVYLLYRFKSSGAATGSFIVSWTAKSLGFLYLPALIYSAWHSESLKNKLIFIPLGLIFGVIGYILLTNLSHFVGADVGFFPEHIRDAIWRNFEMLYPEIPFLVGFTLIANNFKPKENKIPGKMLCIVWILNSFATTPIIFLLSNQFQFVYRFVPLAVFMSIFIAIVIAETCNVIKEYLMNRNNKPDEPTKH